MTELERALVALGRELELPPAPDVAEAVRARVAGPGPRLRRAPLAVALALLAALAVALAVPSARSAILRFLHIRGASVAIVDRLPAVRAGDTSLGRQITLEQTPFRVLLPEGRRPDAVFLAGEVVWLRYGAAEHPRLLVAELRSGDAWLLKKVAAEGADVRYTSIAGEPAIWIGGGAHVLAIPGGARRLAGHTLLWQRGPLTLRLEADVGLPRARELALAFR